jgi:hypothetical protein
MTDLIADQTPDGWLVAGYFTPNYRPYAKTLAASLEASGAPYHLFAHPAAGNWYDNVRRKPGAILKAMITYPARVIVWLDVDCTVKGDLTPITDIAGDVAARGRARRNKKGQRVFFTWSAGTMVFRPTSEAKRFVAQWSAACAEMADPAATDQDGLLIALSQTPGLRIEQLDPHWSATVHEEARDAVIVHDFASRRHRRGIWHRWLKQWTSPPAARGPARAVQARQDSIQLGNA